MLLLRRRKNFTLKSNLKKKTKLFYSLAKSILCESMLQSYYTSMFVNNKALIFRSKWNWMEKCSSLPIQIKRNGLHSWTFFGKCCFAFFFFKTKMQLNYFFFQYTVLRSLRLTARKWISKTFLHWNSIHTRDFLQWRLTNTRMLNTTCLIYFIWQVFVCARSFRIVMWNLGEKNTWNILIPISFMFKYIRNYFIASFLHTKTAIGHYSQKSQKQHSF